MRLETGAKFNKDLKRIKKRGLPENLLWEVVELLFSGETLPRKYNPHRLKGNWVGFMECHITPDWLLIWRQIDDRIILTRTGSHSDLFNK